MASSGGGCWCSEMQQSRGRGKAALLICFGAAGAAGGGGCRGLVWLCVAVCGTRLARARAPRPDLCCAAHTTPAVATRASGTGAYRPRRRPCAVCAQCVRSGNSEQLGRCMVCVGTARHQRSPLGTRAFWPGLLRLTWRQVDRRACPARRGGVIWFWAECATILSKLAGTFTTHTVTSQPTHTTKLAPLHATMQLLRNNHTLGGHLRHKPALHRSGLVCRAVVTPEKPAPTHNAAAGVHSTGRSPASSASPAKGDCREACVGCGIGA
jgi:hypothetical protein